MSPIQQMLLGAGGAVATKNYIDDIFSTNVWVGNDATRTISPGFDLSSSGDGGLVWIKSRSRGDDHVMGGSWLGDNKYIRSNWSGLVQQNQTNRLKTVTSSGFQLGTSDVVNQSPHTYASWCFKNTDNFFKIVEWTGDGSSNRQINHGLGSVPGMIMVKTINASYEWQVFHRSIGETKGLILDKTNSSATKDWWNDTAPNATNFTVGGSSKETNDNNLSYVAFVFAGGESTAATARSVEFDASNDNLEIAHDSALDVGEGSFTCECWFKQTASFTNWRGIFAKYNTTGNGPNNSKGIWLHTGTDGKIAGGIGGAGPSEYVTCPNNVVNLGVWNHVAMVKNGLTLKIYVNGVEQGSVTYGSGFSANNTAPFCVGDLFNTFGRPFGGEISNVRFTVGQALYTSSFKPSTEPFTTTSQGATASNVKLLFCNNSSVTGSTVTTGTITNNNGSTASTDSPFDDPAGFVFGEAGDQNVIKCGSYVGSGSAGLEVNVGFEPQWIMFKNASASYNWYVLDVMRGIVSGGDDAIVAANDSGAEWDSSYIDVTPTGFKLQTSHALGNGSGNTYIYMCLRRPDGYVGKPYGAGEGTSVFAMDTGNTQTTIPNYDSGFPVDFALLKNPGTATSWDVTARLTGTKYLKTDSTTAEANFNDYTFDSNTGWAKDNGPGTMQSWMWKRHAGFDAVFDVGTSADKDVRHGLNAVPQMIWRKNRDSGSSSKGNWIVYHKDLPNHASGNINYLILNSGGIGDTGHGYWYAPTKDVFKVRSETDLNWNGYNYINLLFSSVDGISSVGSYSGSSSDVTVTTGFSPRFVIIKCITNSHDWVVLDTTRGWGSGNDKVLYLNGHWGQQTGDDVGSPISTGFVVDASHGYVNQSGHSYIYYAHA